MPHEATMELLVLKSAELRTAIVVDQDVRSNNGLALLAKGQEVTLSVLGRLKAFASKTGIVEPVRVLVAELETTSTLVAARTSTPLPRGRGSAKPVRIEPPLLMLANSLTRT